MKIFVINLARRTDRRAFMESQLRARGLEAEFIEAVDGTKMSPEDLALYDDSKAERVNGKVLTPAELGCALSHRKIYEKMVAENIPEALILEDDVSLTPEFASLLTNTRLLQSPSWEWLQIDYPLLSLPAWIQSNVWHLHRNPFFLLYALIKFPYILLLTLYEHICLLFISKEHPRILYFPRPLYFASCYIVTQKGAQLLLSLATPVVFPADRLPNQARIHKHFRMRAVFPLLVKQDRANLSSDIELPL